MGYLITDSAPSARYSKQAVDQSIASHNRAQRGRIGKREAALIHALLRGRGGDVEYSWPAIERIIAKGGAFVS
jgi:hypothetical protein